jgi:hypothetical protein
MEPLGLVDAASLFSPPYYYGAQGLRCLIGDQRACVESVLHADFASNLDQRIAPDLTVDAWLAGPDTTTFDAVRPPARSFVSAMITQFGRERFAKFWRSDLPVEAAFASAFSQPLGAWTADWARRQSQGQALPNAPSLGVGATLRAVWLPLVLGWSTLMVVAAGWVARRRSA